MAYSRVLITGFLCLVIVGLIIAPGCGMFASKDDTIQAVVDAGNSQRSEMVTPTGKFSDYQVYRQPGSDVVVFEHKLKPGLQLDKVFAKTQQFKADLVSDLTAADSKSVLESDITLEYLYIDANGDDICRHSVTKEDF